MIGSYRGATFVLALQIAVTLAFLGWIGCMVMNIGEHDRLLIAGGMFVGAITSRPWTEAEAIRRAERAMGVKENI